MKKLLAMALLSGLVGVVAVTSAQTTVQTVTTRESHYAAGSVGAGDVQQWLYQHADYIKGKIIGDPATVGAVSIVYSASRTISGTSVGPMAPGDGPPAPLPPTGQPGDQITLTSTVGGWTQKWSYQWMSGTADAKWVLVEYHYFRKNPA